MADLIKSVDQALLERLSGRSLSDGTPVAVFIEAPDAAVRPNRAFPSISVSLVDMIEDFDRLEGGPEYYESGVDDSAIPWVAEMVLEPTPYRLRYRMDAWAKRALHDRDLAQLIVDALGFRGMITLDTTAEKWLLRVGASFQSIYEGDEKIYRRITAHEVLVELGPNDVTEVKKAHTFRTTFGLSPAGSGEPATTEGMSVDTTVEEGFTG